MRTPELTARLGCANNTLHRLAERGILHPRQVGGHGAGRRGYAFEWDEAEQRAATAVVRFLRSHLMEPGHSSTAFEARDDTMRAIAAAARLELPAGARWLIVAADGSCVRGGDLLAACVDGHRTLIELA